MKQTRLILMAAVAVLAGATGLALGYPVAGLLGGGLSLAMGMAFTNEQQSEFVRQLAAWGVLDPMGGLLQRISAKTADYTVLDPFTATGGDGSGTIFTNRGAAGTVVFTLPAPALRLKGVHYAFHTIVAQIMTVATATADTLISDNDATADSLSTTARIGVRLRVTCDGVSWIATLESGVPAAAFAQTGTVAT